MQAKLQMLHGEMLPTRVGKLLLRATMRSLRHGAMLLARVRMLLGTMLVARVGMLLGRMLEAMVGMPHGATMQMQGRVAVARVRLGTLLERVPREAREAKGAVVARAMLQAGIVLTRSQRTTLILNPPKPSSTTTLENMGRLNVVVSLQHLGQ